MSEAIIHAGKQVWEEKNKGKKNRIYTILTDTKKWKIDIKLAKLRTQTQNTRKERSSCMINQLYKFYYSETLKLRNSETLKAAAS